MRFLPREEKFFHYFLSQSKFIAEAAALLHDGCRKGMCAETAHQIAEIEKKGDSVIHEVFHRLNVTFITPLDPEDIHRLAANLDDVLDGIEEVAHKVQAYRVAPTEPLIRMAEIILGCAKSINLAFSALSEDKPVLEHCIEINRLEGEADQISRTAIAELLDTETNPIQVIKIKEIYELLEMTTDRCEDVADELENVVVKNS